jgi:hypothetical protein
MHGRGCCGRVASRPKRLSAEQAQSDAKPFTVLSSFQLCPGDHIEVQSLMAHWHILMFVDFRDCQGPFHPLHAVLHSLSVSASAAAVRLSEQVRLHHIRLCSEISCRLPYTFDDDFKLSEGRLLCAALPMLTVISCELVAGARIAFLEKVMVRS